MPLSSSRSTLAVSSGLLRYPFMTCGPQAAISPINCDSPSVPHFSVQYGSVCGHCGSISLPVSISTILMYVSGTGTPTVLGRGRVNGFAVRSGLVSLMPYPSVMSAPVNFSNACFTSNGKGAAPDKQPLNCRTFFACFADAGSWLMRFQIVGTPGQNTASSAAATFKMPEIGTGGLGNKIM